MSLLANLKRMIIFIIISFSFNFQAIGEGNVDEVISIERLDSNESCQSWKLTKNQIKEFFLVSTEYSDENSYYINNYDVLYCSINGKLISQGKQWDFKINQGGLGYWFNDDETRIFGCEKNKCDSLNIGSDDVMSD